MCCAIVAEAAPSLAQLRPDAPAPATEPARPAPMRVTLIVLGASSTQAERAVRESLDGSQRTLLLSSPQRLLELDPGLSNLTTLESWSQQDSATLSATLLASGSEAVLLLEVSASGDVAVGAISHDGALRGVSRHAGVAQSWSTADARRALQLALSQVAPEVLRARKDLPAPRPDDAGGEPAPDTPSVEPSTGSKDIVLAWEGGPPGEALDAKVKRELPGTQVLPLFTAHVMMRSVVLQRVRSDMEELVPPDVGGYGSLVLVRADVIRGRGRRGSLGPELGLSFHSARDRSLPWDVSQRFSLVEVAPALVARYVSPGGFLMGAYGGLNRTRVNAVGGVDASALTYVTGSVGGSIGASIYREGVEGPGHVNAEFVVSGGYVRTLSAAWPYLERRNDGHGFTFSFHGTRFFSEYFGVSVLYQFSALDADAAGQFSGGDVSSLSLGAQLRYGRLVF